MNDVYTVFNLVVRLPTVSLLILLIGIGAKVLNICLKKAEKRNWITGNGSTTA